MPHAFLILRVLLALRTPSCVRVVQRSPCVGRGRWSARRNAFARARLKILVPPRGKRGRGGERGKIERESWYLRISDRIYERQTVDSMSPSLSLSFFLSFSERHSKWYRYGRCRLDRSSLAGWLQILSTPIARDDRTIRRPILALNAGYEVKVR